MSKRCPDCHRLNDDGRIYCAFCGEPLDNNVRMIKNIPPVKTRQKKGSAVPWLILLAAAAIALWFFLSR